MRLQDHISKGNKKLPYWIWIFNSGSATNCPSKVLGLCQCADICYAFNAERQYPDVYPYRERQFAITQTTTPGEFADAILVANRRARKLKMKAFRYNESGDFIDQAQVNWFTEVCRIFKAVGIPCYGYTARTDLDLSGLLEVSQVNVSNDRDSWTTRGANRFKAVSEFSGKALKCAGNCRKCSLCQKVSGKTIEVLAH